MYSKTLAIATLGALLGVAFPVLAQTGTVQGGSAGVSVGSKIACVGAAVATRESAIGAAVGTYAQAVNAAYSARAGALAQAYSGTNAKQVRTAVRSAWSAFGTAIRSASRTLKASRAAAWSQFSSAAKACKAPADVSDSAHSGLEMSIQ